MISGLEIIRPISKTINIKRILFDFDGTISTFRQGWESIMEPLMLDMISGSIEPDEKLIEEVKDYINESTGIQTIYQMKWLREKVKEYGLNKDIRNIWDYKKEYNKRLLEMVNSRINDVIKGKKAPDDFLIKGSYEFLSKLKEEGFPLYVFSGTDQPDVINEAKILGVEHFFDGIVGAPVDKVADSKKAVIKHLLNEKKLLGSELFIIGDGKVEISLGAEKGAITLGMATNETLREGINPQKRKRLIEAGANAITGDFKNYRKLLEWFFAFPMKL